jgi:hypothetical protein
LGPGGPRAVLVQMQAEARLRIASRAGSWQKKVVEVERETAMDLYTTLGPLPLA